ncbi:hypothetical protein SNE25_12235 [Mucilaginibacter sabulilitoris]|uniref:MarR family transcriptional regulator n=1 Tax=Mucilaginibacter sabulilitoris TaxID=1173583 RepID=A0ABZ0TT84_9SPHI|nr:hypothetical protein [Mucilaginibacter sabulilitoris]WPU96287.1 hypothetical protein SNE25_12235 [Mucilaginibacter sabulilitoris]
MQPLVELITSWQAYTEQFPDASVEGFCYSYLLNVKKQSQHTDLQLAAQLGKANSIFKTYYKLVLRQMPGIELDWYYFLDIIGTKHELRKTDIVSFTLLLEPTTGIDILNRMLKAGLISERVDPADKRARLIKLTTQGNALLIRLNLLFGQIATLVLSSVYADDKAVISLALSKLVHEQTPMVTAKSGKGIESIEQVIKQLSEKSR